VYMNVIITIYDNDIIIMAASLKAIMSIATDVTVVCLSIYPSVCMSSVTLVYTLLKQLEWNEMPFGRDTRVVQVTLY